MIRSHIVVPTDFSDHARAAAHVATWIAARTGARVTLLHVDHWPGEGTRFGPPSSMPLNVWEAYQIDRASAIQRLLDEERAHLREDVDVACEVARGAIVATVVSAAQQAEADLIVMGTHGADTTGRFLVGSVASGVAARSSVPVLVTRRDHPIGRAPGQLFRRPLVGTDFCPATDRALLQLRDVVEPDAIVDLVHVLPNTTAEPRWLTAEDAAGARDALLAQRSERLQESLATAHAAGMTARSLVRVGQPAHELLAQAREGDNDLIVVGARVTTSGTPWSLGSAADRVLRHSPTPVLVVPPPG